MAIFERIGKGVADMGQGVAQQTKNFAEVNRINGLIADMKQRETALICEIGRAYYELHKDEAGSEFADKLSRLREMEIQLEMWNEQIKQLRGVIKCRNCGANIQKGMQFCSACGMKVEEQQCCSNCGKPVPEGVRFCVNCGAKMPGVAPTAEDGTKYEAHEKYCLKCGTRISEQDCFCPECGVRVFGTE